ncbi:type II secretion system F family protein [Anaerovorax odorimutans]|uniref:type II secretion system F family protein n=1 Tax=Anaerovorax odorimutans TaxID=109327 RepID=UPI000424BF22|nr:type II secretion system F family protein [Anaerovorax odorimutans]
MIYYIVITCGIFIFCCVILALRPYGEQHDVVQKRINHIFNNFQKGYDHDDELSLPFWERIMKLVIKPLIEKIKNYIIKNPNQWFIFKSFKNNKLKKNIYKAGFTMELHEYQIIRAFIILGTTIISFSLVMFLGKSFINCLIAAILGFYFGYVVLRFHLASRINKRHKAMEKQLPEVLDLLSVNVEAGLGFEQAISHVIEHLEGPLIDELTITYREMSMGRSRRDALLIFSNRCDINEIKSFIGSIIQAGELGISIKNVLRSQAVTMRQNRRNKVEEKAQKISTKILLPMILFIFPVIFIILMGPAVVKILNQFGGGGL